MSHYYVVEDMLKLSPRQLMWLFESVNGPKIARDGEVFAWKGEHFPYHGGTSGTRGIVECFIADLGDLFHNNGETFAETVGHVIQERGGHVGEVTEMVEAEVEGIVREEAGSEKGIS